MVVQCALHALVVILSLSHSTITITVELAQLCLTLLFQLV